MTPERRISDELRPYVDRAHIDEVDEIGARLSESRSSPSPAFRSELRAKLEAGDSKGATRWRPRNLRLVVAAYSGAGLLLIAIAALGVSGSGPLGY